RERREGRRRPLPAVADEIFDAVAAGAFRMRAGGLWIPAREVANDRRRTDRRALILGLGRKAPAAPLRIRRRFGLADVARPRQRQRNELEHPAPVPPAPGLLPERRRRR